MYQKTFFEKGLKILKNQGIFCFICSNKFAKAKYGEKLRKFILNNQLKIYNDFTGIKVFKEASVDTCVIQIKKDFVKDNEIFVNDDYFMSQNKLDSNSFTFNSPEILNLRDKIFNQGTMIKDLDIQINYGIKTGFNDAFIIDEETKNRLIKEDSNNKEIIKPLLRGRDLNKWKIMYKNLYLIHSVDGLDTKNKYPSIYKFLSQYQEKLEKRYDKGRYWYNLRSCKYDDLFEKEKLIYPNIASGLYPVYDNDKYYTNQKCFILTSETINIKYLNGLMASNVLNFMFSLIGSNLGSKGFDLNKVLVEQLPIKIDNEYHEKVIKIIDEIKELSEKISKNEKIMYDYLTKELYINKFTKKIVNFYELTEKQFIKEIKKINTGFDEKDVLLKFNSLKTKMNALNKDLIVKNNELDQIVYKIYNLSDEEIKIIEDKINY
ncbi:TaqI-like C-terminal specificity domain-containing protein [Methanobrevibacter ruminantium]|uniref:TaqI-like C-terminal specificity domain-containing protein n=1 Tax=Methanobrevibacter ruminantium TaxID=83816 RepID=UPI003FA5C641